MTDRLKKIEWRHADVLAEWDTEWGTDDYTTLITDDIPWLVARVRELEATLYDLTPGGSEFQDSPDVCANWIARRLQSVIGVVRRYQEQALEDADKIAKLEAQAAMDAKVREAAQEYVAAREASSKAFMGVFETVDMTDELREQRYAANAEADERVRDAWHTLQTTIAPLMEEAE